MFATIFNVKQFRVLDKKILLSDSYDILKILQWQSKVRTENMCHDKMLSIIIAAHWMFWYTILTIVKWQNKLQFNENISLEYW